MKNSTADKLLLLFSADWFVPFWPMAELSVGTHEVGQFQREARLQVKEMLDDAKVYYDVAFTDVRLGHTASALSYLIDKYTSQRSCVGSKIIHEASDNDAREANLLSSITPMVIGDREFLERVGLTSSEIALLESNWAKSISRTKQLELADQVASPWDRFLVGLTPDVPTMLKDFAVEHFAVKGAFVHFWSSVQAVLPESQDGLLERYRSLAAELAGVALELHWLN